MDKYIKLKLSDITTKNSEVSSFSLSYSGRKINNSEASYQIISALKSKTGLFLELNSSLLNMEAHDKMSLAEGFVEKLQQFGIEYHRKKTIVTEGRKLLSISLEGRKVEGFEIHSLVPNEVWSDSEFKKVIPQVGLKYYLPFENSEVNLSAFLDLGEEEMLKTSRFVIFDNIMLANMGISTVHLTKDDISQLLK